jgi:hypothetical protein
MQKLFIPILSLTLICIPAHADDLAAPDEKTLAHEANAALAGKDYQTAFEKFSILAEHGKAAAQFNLGAFYLNGQGTQKDDKKALEWFGKSAIQGNARALQVIEKAAARGNAYARNELKKIQEQATPAQTPTPTPALASAPTPTPTVSQPKKQTTDKVAEDMFIYKAPYVATRNQWALGASADYFNNMVSEALPYSVSGVTYKTTKNYSHTQTGFSAWVGYDDLSIIASYKSGRSTVDVDVPGAGTIGKSFQTKELAVDVRWLLRNLSSSHLMPYVLLGYSQSSNDGSANELEFQDAYSQKDRVLALGAGAIIPLNETLGIQVDVRVGSDKQKRSDSYTASPGVTLSFYSRDSSSTADFSRLSASMYYNIYEGWCAQLGAKHESYPDGAGSSVQTTGIYATLGYSYK